VSQLPQQGNRFATQQDCLNFCHNNSNKKKYSKDTRQDHFQILITLLILKYTNNNKNYKDTTQETINNKRHGYLEVEVQERRYNASSSSSLLWQNDDDKTNLKTTITTICSTSTPTTTLFSSFTTVMRRTLLLVTNISKIRIKIRIKRRNPRNILIQLLNQTHVLHHIIRHSRLLILVHLLNYCPVPIKHRLNLPEALVQRLPCFGIAVFSILHVRVVVVCWCGGGTAAALILLGTVVGVFHGGGRWIKCGHMKKKKKNKKRKNKFCFSQQK